MSRRLSNPFMVLPKYWFSINEHRQIQAGSLEALHSLALRADPEHIPAALGAFSDMVMDEMCKDLPKGLCTGGSESLKMNKATFPALKAWVRAVRETVATVAVGEDPFVDRVEAERRAAICVECPANKHGGTCLSCTGFSAASRIFLRGRKTIYDAKLDTCRSCGCLLKTKVYIKTELLDRIDERNGVAVDDYEDRCWRRG